MKKILKWLGIVLIGAIVIGLSIGFSPIILLISVGLFWFFSKKKPNDQYKQYAKYGIIVGAIGSVILVFTPMDESEEVDAPDADTEEVAEKEDADEVEEGQEETEEETEDKDEETEAEEAEETEEKDEEDSDYEIVEDMAVFTGDSDSIFSTGGHVKNFSTSMTDSLKDNHKELENGAIFRSIKTLQDQMGNEEQSTVIAVWYSQDTIDKINFENWPMIVAEDLYKTADAFWVHPAFREEDGFTQKGNEEAPSLYYEYIGGNE